MEKGPKYTQVYTDHFLGPFLTLFFSFLTLIEEKYSKNKGKEPKKAKTVDVGAEKFSVYFFQGIHKYTLPPVSAFFGLLSPLHVSTASVG